jgi:hypothetical protein
VPNQRADPSPSKEYNHEDTKTRRHEGGTKKKKPLENQAIQALFEKNDMKIQAIMRNFTVTEKRPTRGISPIDYHRSTHGAGIRTVRYGD